jgi:hypothetical protein
VLPWAATGSRHTRNVNRVSQAMPWAADLAHDKTNGPGRRTWRAMVLTCVLFVSWAMAICSRERAALAMCVVCVVSPISRLTAQSGPRRVFSSCCEPSQPAHGIEAWHRVLRVCREPPRKLTANRHLCREPDVCLTATKRLTAALRFPVVKSPPKGASQDACTWH